MSVLVVLLYLHGEDDITESVFLEEHAKKVMTVFVIVEDQDEAGKDIAEHLFHVQLQQNKLLLACTILDIQTMLHER